MHQIKNVADLEAIVGKPPALVMMKAIAKLDEGCVRLLAHSPVAGFGYLTQAGNYHTTMVGGLPGFVRVESATSISFDFPAELAAPAPKSGVSFVFLLPGVGETLRLNGTVAEVVAGRLTVAVAEAYIHCAMAILRSRLWSVPTADSFLVTASSGPAGAEPLREPAIARLLAASPFIFVSSWDAKGASDTSPRGDEAGFLQVLDGQTLALPDRKGNKRTDTFHNIVSRNRLSLVALVPGSELLLHLCGNASITAEESLLATMNAQGKPPQAALLLDVESASITHSSALQQAQLWRPSSHVDLRNVPDMMALALQHLQLNESAGLLGKLSRFLGRLLGGSPKFVRTLINAGYKSQLQAEGHAAPVKREPLPLKRGVGAKLAGYLPPRARQKTQQVLYRLSGYLSRAAQTLDSGPLSPPAAPGHSLSREVRVLAVKRETAAAVTLVLEDVAGNPFAFKPGQFFTLLLDINGEQVVRAYSASNAPGTNQLTMTIKQVADGVCSSYVNQQIKPGDQLKLVGPAGNFHVTPAPTASREYVLLASGSGVTPLMSIAQTVLATEPTSSISVLYGNRRWEDVIFAQAWADLSQRYPDRLQVQHLLSTPHPDWAGRRGRLDEATARQELLTLAPSPQAHFYVCGPEPMMNGVTAALTGLGVSADRIHAERFGRGVPPAVGPALLPQAAHLLTIQQQRENRGEVMVPAGKTLLQAGLNAHLPLPFSCGMGNCGECRLKLVAGEVTMAEPNCLSASDRQQGFILTCVARPLTATIVELAT